MPVIRSLLTAFSTYSRIPVPQVEWNEENRRYSMCFFPLVGLVIGLFLWGWLALCRCSGIGPLIRGAVAALLPLAITGGIHMDGYMDTTDALASWQPVEKRLEILKDSHAGAFAVMGCAGYLLLSAALYAEASPETGIRLVGVFVLSRALSAFALVKMKKARNRGMLNDTAGAAEKKPVVFSCLIYSALCLTLWTVSGGWIAALCASVAVLCYFLYQHMAYTQFGGITGDLAGWFLQVTELALTAAVVLGGKWL